MPRGTILTERERERILAYHECKMSARAIAKKLGRSADVVCRFLRAPAAYDTTKRPGPKPKLKTRDLRRLLTAACKGLSTAKQLRYHQQVPLGVRRVQQILSNAAHLRWEQRQKMPWMTPAHMKARVNWARDQLLGPRDWTAVVFSDEKKFNLDGPDGIQYYWRDLRKEPQYFKKRQSGGGSIMVWGGFAADGKTALAILEGKQNAEKYCETLASHLRPCGRQLAGPRWVFQQDNASIHTARATMAWFAANRVDVLPWPARSPDLNPVENLWGLMVRRVYANGRCYENVALLRAAIISAWSKISATYLQTLIKSMNKRCVEVIFKKGHVIDY
jgi:transposase